VTQVFVSWCKLADNVLEVEFVDDEGQTYAELALPSSELLVLHHRRIKAA